MYKILFLILIDLCNVSKHVGGKNIAEKYYLSFTLNMNITACGIIFAVTRSIGVVSSIL